MKAGKWYKYRAGYQKELREKRNQQGLCSRCGGERVEGLKCCAKCRERYITDNTKYHQQLKDEVFTAYGGYVCACCGEDQPEFLSIDHKNNDGAAHRKSLQTSTQRGTGGWVMYLQLRKLGFPEGYQVLCMNCNWGKRRTGICPHKKETQNELN